MKKILSVICLMLIAVSCFFVGTALPVYGEGETAPESFKEATLEQGDKLDENIERLNFDDLYLSSLTEFDQNNSANSMFGGFIKTGRIVSSFEVSYDICVMDEPNSNSNFGLGIKNVISDKKLNLIQSGGYEVLFGNNARLKDIATTSLSTISIVKNGALLSNNTSNVVSYAVFGLPTWLDFDQGAEFNLKIGAIMITDNEGDEIKGYYIYVKASNATNNESTIAEVYDYCDIDVNIGGVITGVVKGTGKYQIYTKNTDNITTLEDVVSYDLMQLDQGTTSHYTNKNAGKKMFGCADVATDLSLEVSMRITVDKPTTAWQTLSFGLKNCQGSLGGNYVFQNCGYTFAIGNLGAQIGQDNYKTFEGCNNYKTLSIRRNDNYVGKEFVAVSIQSALMPEWFDQTLRTEGGTFIFTIGLRRIIDGEDVLGYYGYMKADGETLIDFYDYFDYQANLDYFGDAFSGGIEANGSYYITTCGTVNKNFDEMTEFDLSELVPVSQDGLAYTVEEKTTEKVIGRYVRNKESLSVSFKLNFVGTPKLDLSLRGLDDSSNADGIRYVLNTKNNSVRIYTMATKEVIFDSGELDLSARDITLTENTDYQINYGVKTYVYEGVGGVKRAQLFFEINGITVYAYNYDYINSSSLGYYVGGRITGNIGDSVKLIPLKNEQLTLGLTASLLKEDILVGERNAVNLDYLLELGVVDVDYQVISGADIISVNNYGVITGIKAGTAVIKVKVQSQYGEIEGGELSVVVKDTQAVNDPLKDFANDYYEKNGAGGCSASVSVLDGSILAVIAIIAAAAMLVVRNKKRAK